MLERKAVELETVVSVSSVGSLAKEARKRLLVLEDPIGPSNLYQYYEYEMRYEAGMTHENEKERMSEKYDVR